MTIRKKVFIPNEILSASEINDLSDNGVIEIFSTADLADADLDLANAVYIISDRSLRVRTGAGTGASNWSAPVWTGNPLPTQTGNSGKFLTTDGTSTSWATVETGGGTSSLPAGGLTGQVLAKASDDDYDFKWVTVWSIEGSGGQGVDPASVVVPDGSITGGTKTSYSADGKTYNVHTFTYNAGVWQALTVNQGVIGQLMIIGGGGAGGFATSGKSGSGGGAGALWEGNYAFGVGIHSLVVGNGGVIQDNNHGRNGETTRFDEIYARGGGGGGMSTVDTTLPGQDGGSGGGGGPNVAAGAALLGVGGDPASWHGSIGESVTTTSGAHGGGAGGTPTVYTNSPWYSTITGTNTAYGWGGLRGVSNNGSNAYTAPGSGGSGRSGTTRAATNGIPGIVIVRYRIA